MTPGDFTLLEPRFKHAADVQRIQLFVFGAVDLRSALVIHLAAGHVEAQHRTELRPHSDGDILRQRQLPAVVIAALVVIDALVARFQPGGVHVVPEVHRTDDGAVVLRLSVLSLPLS